MQSISNGVLFELKRTFTPSSPVSDKRAREIIIEAKELLENKPFPNNQTKLLIRRINEWLY